jgi:RNA polymerase sigma factor (sigma-70 family)
MILFIPKVDKFNLFRRIQPLIKKHSLGVYIFASKIVYILMRPFNLKVVRKEFIFMDLYYLLANAQKGDQGALIILLKNFHPTIKNHARRLGYTEAETDLIIVFLETVNAIDIRGFLNAVNRDKQIAGFIHKILRNKTVDLFKKHVKNHKSFISLDYELIQDQKVHNFANDVCIDMLIEALPPMQREIIKRKFIDGFSNKQIAKTLGVTTMTVARNKKKGLDNLRNNLCEYEEDRIWNKKYLN